ncbi:MAG TPA: hypothetical protein VM911_07590 [Pyrinomonadaceae bacterium]|jgi:hypothetical protein|nr:hypothetical protein [Pyrinomonadaceae bacterium]
MSANPTDTANTNLTAKEAPTAQQTSQPGVPKKITNAQTVCNEKNEKGKLCNGHLKQLRTGGEEADKHLRGDDVMFKCQTCGALYMGPPLGHVRDPKKQSRFVEKELMAILQAAGGTLPAFKMSERGTLVPVEESAHHAPAPAAEAKPATTPTAKPAAPAPGPKAATTPASSSGAPAGQVRDSSAQADAHRPAAEAQAATGQASAAPMSPAAATASPAAGAETVADLAPEASTELTPGAPPDTRKPDTTTATETPASSTEEGTPEQK